MKYHPRFRNIWSLPDFVTGRPTKVGLAQGFLACNLALVEILFSV